MPGTPPPLLRGRFATSSPDAAHDFLRTAYAEHTVVFTGDPAGFRFATDYVQDPSFGIDRVRHSMAVRVDAEPPGQLLVVRARRGRLTVSEGREELTAEAGEFLVLSPTARHRAHWVDVDASVIRLEIADLAQVATEVTGVRDPEFRLARPHDAGCAAHLLGAIRYVERDILGVPAAADSPLLRAEAFRCLVTAVLHAFPNRALATPREAPGPAPGAEPAVVRRAVRYIDEHAAEPVNLGAIAAAAGVGVRTLQLAFRAHHDLTPMQYLRRVRLAHAHRELLAADPATGVTVAAVATRWGFVNHGHFATRYQREYGCPPSATLRG